mmetsp:Transcript_110/g.162  ORF Transcript_110/g.162 Transcript_110/m.162 type:complete len:105 (-) Transcript_110:120-434(-)
MPVLKTRGWLNVIALGALGLTTACVTGPIEPAVSSFNEASVGIQLPDMTYVPADQRALAISKADAKAAEICKRGPNRRAEYVSSRTIPVSQYTAITERLYLCLS